jgi:fructosamine-3-kinase
VIDPVLRRELETDLGAEVARATPVGGGDVCLAMRLQLADGRLVFVKMPRGGSEAGLEAEASGLRWLAEAGVVFVPEVLAVSPRALVLPWLEPGPRAGDFDERLGRELAALHRAGAPGFGLGQDNFIATLPQQNRATATWAQFWHERRLAPLVVRAFDEGRLGRGHRRRFELLFARIEALAGPVEAPARLHGDLWAGNVHVAPDGGPALIDPAVYGGHREVDLAMMRLFGGFSARTFAAYAEVHPLAPGSDERVPLWQLYPLLVHAILFGRTWVDALERALARLGV